MRRLALSVLVMLPSLPLLWIQVIRTPAGAFFVHEIAMFVAVASCVTTLSIRGLLIAWSRVWWWTLSMTLGLAVWAAASLYHELSLAATAKQALYLGSFVVLVSLFGVAAADPQQTIIRTLRWSGVLTLLTLLVAFAVSSVVNAVQPLAVLTEALISGSPEVLEQELFRPLFAGFGYSDSDAVSQFRHEVFAGLLISLLVAAWACSCAPLRSRLARGIYTTGVVVGLGCVVLSLSRSVLLAAITWPALHLIRFLVHGRLTRGQAATTALAVVSSAAAIGSGYATILFTRVASDVTSYGDRTQRWQLALEDIRANPWSGGRYYDQISSHNFVVDAWLRGGAPMALLMLVALGVVLVRAVGTGRLAVQGPARLVPVAAAFALPIVRMFTIGGGLLQPAEWVALAFAFAVSTHELALRRGPTRTQVALPVRLPQAV